MEIVESIYDGVLEPSYKQYTRSDATRAGHSRKNRGESALVNNYSAMSEISGKRIKRYVYHPKGESKTYLIYVPGNSSY